MANPPFSHPGRTPQAIAVVSSAWVPPAPSPFEGGWQPLAQRKRVPPVSIDNPPTQDDERAAVMEVIFNIWNLPIQLLPQLPRKLNPSLLSVDPPAPYEWELVVLDAEDQSAYYHLPRSKIAAIVAQAVTSASGSFSSAGVSTANLVGASVTADNPPGYSTDLLVFDSKEWTTYYRQPRRFVPQSTAVSASGALSSAGLASGNFIGSSTAASRITSAGVGTASFATKSSSASRLTSAGAATATLVGSSLAGGSAALSSAGVSTANLTTAQISSGAFSSAGRGTARLVGKKVGGVAQNLDGWRPRTSMKRRRRDEEELMLMAAALMPLLNSQNHVSLNHG